MEENNDLPGPSPGIDSLPDSSTYSPTSNTPQNAHHFIKQALEEILQSKEAKKNLVLMESAQSCLGISFILL
jgi:hypothetical protein